MKVQTMKLIGLAAVAATFLACGGGPDIEQVKADFNSPSGSTSDKNGVVAANGARGASSGPSALGAGGVPGQGLSAEGKAGFESISIQRMWSGRATQLRDMIFFPTRAQAAQTVDPPSSGFDSDPIAPCSESPEAKAAYNDLVKDLIRDAINPLGGSSISGSADYTQDFSGCTNGKVTGSAKISLEFEAEGSGDSSSFKFSISYDMTKVCRTEGDMACVTGEMIAELSAQGSNMAGSLQGTTAWKIDGTWQQDGAARSAKLKGGIRTTIEGNGTAGSIKIEMLVYVTPKDGDEQSYVWQFEVSGDGMGNGMAKWLVRGKDGMIECTLTSEGGMCTATGANGMATVSWTKEEAQSIDGTYFQEG